MAIYHCSIKIISRGKGQSAVAAAAYRAGELIQSGYDGITHDYTRKGGVVHTEILLPRYAPEEYAKRSVLWNAVEQIEKAKNSQLAREVELALPAELTLEENISLVREYVTRHFVSVGMCADVCVHDKNNCIPIKHVFKGQAQNLAERIAKAVFRFNEVHIERYQVEVAGGKRHHKRFEALAGNELRVVAALLQYHP